MGKSTLRQSLLGQSESMLKHSTGNNNAHSSELINTTAGLFVNPGVIIWSETAISCYSDVALPIPAGIALRERKAGRDSE